MLLDRELQDRTLAQQVVTRFHERMERITLPFLDSQGDWWDKRLDDPRLGPGMWAIAWQQAVGAYFLHVAAHYFGWDSQPGILGRASAIALRGAQAVVDHCWHEVPMAERASVSDSFGRIHIFTGEVDRDGVAIKHEVPVVEVAHKMSVVGSTLWVCSPQVPTASPDTAPADGSFNYFGMSLAPATILRSDPQSSKARELWNWLLANMTTAGQAKWMPPEVS